LGHDDACDVGRCQGSRRSNESIVGSQASRRKARAAAHRVSGRSPIASKLQEQDRRRAGDKVDRIFEWELKVDGQIRKFLPQAEITYNDPDLVLQAVLEGHGVAKMSG